MKKVSIIITNYRYHEYLEQCVDSVLNQHYGNIELILVNDDHDKAKWDRSLKNPLPASIKTINLPRRYGLASAANQGFSEATGDYFFRLDADDWLQPNCISVMVGRLSTATSSDAVFSQFFIVENGNRFIGKQKSTPYGSCMLMKASVFNSLGGYNEHLTRQEDYDLYQRMNRLGVKIARLDTALWNYRKHPQQMSKNYNAVIEARHKLKPKWSVKNLIVIPARMNSKEVRRKNLKKIGGKSLLVRAIERAKAVDIDAKIIVSSESKEALTVAEDHGVTGSLRPDRLSEDEVSTISVVQYVYEEQKNSGDWDADVIVTLQPTSPFLLSNSVRMAYDRLVSENLTSIVSMVYGAGKHPYRAYYNTGGMYKQPEPLFPELSELFLQRQERAVFSWFTGGFYIRTRKTLMSWDGYNFALGNNWRGFNVDTLEGIDIDSQLDLILARAVADAQLSSTSVV